MLLGAVVRGVKNPLHFGLAKRLRAVRLQRGLGRKPLSELAQLPGNAVQRIEAEGRLPSVELVEKLAAALQVSPCYLAYGVERPYSATARLLTAELAERLRAARDSHELSLNALAQAAGVARTTIGYIEQGQTTPSIATVELLAHSLRVSVCWLAFGEGEMVPASKSLDAQAVCDSPARTLASD